MTTTRGDTHMEPDLLGLFERGSEWTATKVPAAATKLDTATPCDDWDVRTLMNHMLDTQHYLRKARARREDVARHPRGLMRARQSIGPWEKSDINPA